MDNKKKISWVNLALMAFTTVWGFGNVINGFSNFGGTHAVVPWLVIILLYFVPYSLMVGEMGSTFSKEDGGVSSWVNKTMGRKFAFYAGWMYFVVHIPYLSQKPSRLIVAGSWAIFQENLASNLSIVALQGIGLAIFLIALYLATKGLTFLKRISAVAGTSTFVMSMMYIVMMILAPAINPNANVINISLSDFTPEFNLQLLSSLSILIFAVGGCEKISPYVNKMREPGKDFPRGMIALAIMVAISAILGTAAMGMMFDSANIPNDLMTNGAYYAFKILGEHYGLGNLLLIIFAVADFVQTATVVIISIDAPLQIFLNSADKEMIPSWLLKKNKNGIYINGIKAVGIAVSLLIILPVIGINDIDQLVKWLVKLNSVCMPLRYLWVFLCYIVLKKNIDKFEKADYVFIKNKTLGIIMGAWCFILTAISCILGMKSDNSFELIMNIITPIVLIASGLLMPLIAKKTNAKQQ